MHGDRDYLKFLQESTFKNRSQIGPETIPINENEETELQALNRDLMFEIELRDELSEIFEDEELQEIDYAGITSKYGGKWGAKAIDQAQQSGMTQGASAVAIVGAAVAAGVMIYKRFMSKAAKACEGLPTSEKTNCMRKHKADGIKAKIAKFQSFKGKCDQAKNPTGCNNKLMFKIKAEKSKLGSE